MVWYKKHFLLEVLYYIPYTYISILIYISKLAWKGIFPIINSAKTHSTSFAGMLKNKFGGLVSRLKTIKINVPKVKLAAPRIVLPKLPKVRFKPTDFGIKKFLIGEYNGFRKEFRNLYKLAKRLYKVVSKWIRKFNSIEIEINLPKPTIPQFKLPEMKKPEIALPVIKPAVIKSKTPRSSGNFFSRITNILFWPFRMVIKIIKAVFNFEIRFRLFSFRTFLIVFFLIGLYLGTAAYLIIWEDLPKVEALAMNEPRQTTTIYDRKGNILYRLYDDEDRSLVPVNSIPQNLINATVAIEDESFFTHNGLSLRGIARAAKRTFFEEDLEGGSTITQQLVKNSLLTSERTYERKAKEAIIAIEVERKYSKEQILEMYLNRISYGGTAYGIKSAAKKYFNKELADLTLAESAFLAGLPAAPSNYSPFAGNLEAGLERQKLVLARMVSSQFISQTEADEAAREELQFESPAERIVAPHFVNYVISELEDKYGQMMVAQGGLDVFTSIDMELQTELENVVEAEVTRLSRNNVSNGAALITDPKTGEVLAMVGSKDYWDKANDGNVNITVSPRQPGSSIKPLTYSLALENGYTVSSILDDSSVTYQQAGQAPYKPVNYDGKFHGKVTIKQALANSYNIPAVKLLDELGVETLVEHGKNMGITTWNDSSRFGLALTLGAGEVKMTDMAVLYGTFANQGYRRDLNPILKIYDSYGNVIEENDCVDFLDESPSILTRRAWFETNAVASTSSNVQNQKPRVCKTEKVLSNFTAYMISNILTDNRARSAAFGSNSELNVTKKQFAVKTGTTNNEKDNWAIGYNDDFVVLTWVGNNYNEPMRGLASGYVGSSTIWRKTVNYLIDNREMAEVITRPEGLVEVSICPLTNTLACSGCPNVKQIYEKGKEPKYACDPDVIKKMLDKDDEDKDKDEDKQDEKSEEENAGNN